LAQEDDDEQQPDDDALGAQVVGARLSVECAVVLVVRVRLEDPEGVPPLVAFDDADQQPDDV
jgi:hypothetical protein